MIWNMNRAHELRELSVDELLGLQRLLRAEKTPGALFRRCRLVWLLAGGFSIADASAYVGLHYTNAHRWVKRFEAEGLDGLCTRSRPGRPKVYGDTVEDLVVDIATSRPKDLGLGFKTWSLTKLSQHLHDHEDLPDISHETVRGILRRHGLRFLTGKTWCESTDPDFEAKKGQS
ncbi:MAG: helix-turn-helix domain-containing protein [Planctomycetota bacterium]|nr:helix-turn-helix domain-containing protein [Planctomycetota bacterium]